MSRDGLRLPNGATTSTFEDITRTDVPSGSYPLKRALDVAVSGGASTPITASTETLTTVERSATVVTLLAANTSRLGYSVWNRTTDIAYVRHGSGASLTSYKYALYPNELYETDDRVVYTGIVTVIWPSAGAGTYLNVSEQTA